MGGMILWLFVSYAMLIGVGTALFREGHWPVGLLIIVGVPALRVALRFRERGGYRLIGDLTKLGGNLADRGGVARRSETPRWFKLCLFSELAVVLTIYGLFFVAPMFE